MITNINRHDKLSGYHVIYMEVKGEVYPKKVDQWIALEPVLLYQAVMGKVLCCMTYPDQIRYYPSLQYTVLKKLEEAVSKIKPQLVGEKETRKLKRVASAHFKKKEMEKQKELEIQKEIAKKKRSNGIWR